MTNKIDSDGAAAAAEAARRAAEARARAIAEAARRAAEAAAKAAAAAAAKAAAAAAAKVNKAKQKNDEFSTGKGGALRRSIEKDQASQVALKADAPTFKLNELKAGKAIDTPAKDPLPKDPADLPKTFPELKDKQPAELKKTYDDLVTLRDGDVNQKLTAVANLAQTFSGSLDKVVAKVDTTHSPLVAKVAADPDALKAAGTLADGKASVGDKAKAALTLASKVNDAAGHEELKGVLQKALGATGPASKLVDAIDAFTDPDASKLDKAKAAFELADSVKGYAGAAAPSIAKDLGKLDGTFKIVGSALTLLDPDASAQDKALAAAQIAAVEVPDVGKDLKAFGAFLGSVGVKQPETVAADAQRIAASGLAGLTPELSSKLSATQLDALKTAAADPESGEAVKALLGQLSNPKQVDALVGQLGKTTDGPARKALVETLGKLDPETFDHVLTASVDGSPLLEKFAKVVESLPEDARGSLGKLVEHFDADAIESFTQIAEKVDGKALGGLLEATEGIDSKLAGKAIGAILKLVEKAGVKLTGEVALKVLEGVGKVIPIAGAVVSGIDTVRFGAEAANTSLPPDLRMFATVTAGLNGVDTALGVIEATGIGNVDAPVQVALGIGEVAMSIAYDSEKAKYEADPKGYKAPAWMKAVNIAGAVATAPAGLVALAAIYGPEGAAQLLQDGAKAGAKGSIEAARQLGISQADLAGDSLKTQGALMHQLADVIRNPGKYGEKVKELATAAADQFNKVIEKGGQLAEAAKKELTDAVDAAKKLGAQGLDTLKFIAQNPGAAAKIAVDGINDLINKGVDLATDAGKALYQKAVDTLGDLKKGWESLSGAAKEKAKALIDSTGQVIDAALNKAVELGDKAVDLVAWAATHPGEAADKAKAKLGELLQQGGEVAKKAWDVIVKLGDKGKDLAESAIRGLKDAGEQAIDTLKYVVNNPGQAAKDVQKWVGQTFSDLAHKGGELGKKAAQAVGDFIQARAQWAKDTGIELFNDGVDAFKDVVKSWKDNLTDGGKEFLSGLSDLGDAGVGALKEIAGYGGQLTDAAVGHLGDLVRDGNKLAVDALQNLANLPGEVAKRAGDVIKGLGDLIPHVSVHIPGTNIDLGI